MTTITRAHVEQGIVTEGRWANFTADASDLRLPPGEFPTRIQTELGNGRPFVRLGIDDTGSGHYLQEAGCIELTIYND
jgi:hypothetical protein